VEINVKKFNAPYNFLQDRMFLIHNTTRKLGCNFIRLHNHFVHSLTSLDTSPNQPKLRMEGSSNIIFGYSDRNYCWFFNFDDRQKPLSIVSIFRTDKQLTHRCIPTDRRTRTRRGPSVELVSVVIVSDRSENNWNGILHHFRTNAYKVRETLYIYIMR